MADRGEPPEGPPGSPTGGSEDEYRSLVFDESFVRAARLQEFSAQERMEDHAPAVRSLPPRHWRTGSRAAIALILLIALAFGTAVFMGLRHPYQAPVGRRAEPLTSTVVPWRPGAPYRAEPLRPCSPRAPPHSSEKVPRASTCRRSGGRTTSRTARWRAP